VNKINYIPAFYIGERKHSGYAKELQNNQLIMVEKQIEALNKTDIQFVTFAFNLDDITMSQEIEEKIKSYNINFNYECYFRQNKGCSYGAWNDVIIKNLNDFDYFFIIEDDFIPIVKDFYVPFIERSSYEIPYVCEFTDSEWKGLPHASIPHGIMRSDACKFIYEKYGNVLKTYEQDNRLETFYKIQMECYEYFINEGFGITDILDAYSAPFMSSPTRTVTIFGDPKNPVLLDPIIL
jgi:hypothetical protein